MHIKLINQIFHFYLHFLKNLYAFIILKLFSYLVLCVVTVVYQLVVCVASIAILQPVFNVSSMVLIDAVRKLILWTLVSSLIFFYYTIILLCFQVVIVVTAWVDAGDSPR
ncbi:unnamed protein product [Lymnaea stagnalis]|uniref:Uncharacterized protein n=1 Tax=Lymnaea stagnalis TaxID=6523 RepID=A0AAV2I443_LYMST